MPVFEYTARTASGEETTDSVELATKEDVAAHLRKKRMRVVRVLEAKEKAAARNTTVATERRPT